MELDRVIVTYDQDFLSEAQRRQAEGIRFAGICYAPKRSVVIGQMIADLELLATISEPEEVANRVFFLPFR